MTTSQFNTHTINHTLTGLAVKDAVGVTVGLPEVGKAVGAELKVGIELILGLALGTPPKVTVSTVILCPT